MIWCYSSRKISVCIMNCSYQFERGNTTINKAFNKRTLYCLPFSSGDTRRGDSDVSNQRADGAGFVL